MDTIAVNRYAQALFDTARARGEEQKIRDDISLLGRVFKASGLEAFFESPRFSYESKRKVVDEICKKSSSGIIARFLGLLLLKSRAGLLPQIALKYEELFKASKGITTCEVFLAVEPSKELSASIREHLERITGGDVEMNIHTNEKILGGVEIRIAHRMIDVSFLSGLNNLTESLEFVKVT